MNIVMMAGSRRWGRGGYDFDTDKIIFFTDYFKWWKETFISLFSGDFDVSFAFNNYFAGLGFFIAFCLILYVIIRLIKKTIYKNSSEESAFDKFISSYYIAGFLLLSILIVPFFKNLTYAYLFIGYFIKTIAIIILIIRLIIIKIHPERMEH